ncbi:MAG: hypothetical protein U0736_20645 [Gemmataceae bacterium]
MSQATAAVSSPNAGQADPDGLEQFQSWLLRSPTVSRVLIIGVPLLGMLASLTMHLPLFSTLMSGCFLFAATLTCRQAILTFTGTTLRLLVMARVVLILVLAALLFCTTGASWAGLASALLLWLVSDRLLGRRALHDLFKLCRPKP